MQSKEIFDFLDRYSKCNDSEFDDSFRNELHEIGKLMKERFVTGEKRLYFLYQPPNIS